MSGLKSSMPPEGDDGAHSTPQPVALGCIPIAGGPIARATDRVHCWQTLQEIDRIAGRIEAAADRLERDGDRPAMARLLRDDAVRLRGEITNSVRGMR